MGSREPPPREILPGNGPPTNCVSINTTIESVAGAALPKTPQRVVIVIVRSRNKQKNQTFSPSPTTSHMKENSKNPESLYQMGYNGSLYSLRSARVVK